jgi:hypothetical protein
VVVRKLWSSVEVACSPGGYAFLSEYLTACLRGLLCLTVVSCLAGGALGTFDDRLRAPPGHGWRDQWRVPEDDPLGRFH